MIINAVENFVLFCTVLMIVSFCIAITIRSFASRGVWSLHPHTLSKIYSLAIVLPPVVSAWIACAAFLPRILLGEDQFEAAHTAPLHKLHLIGELTERLEPVLAYLTLTFLISTTCFVLYSAVRGYWRINNIVKKLELTATLPSPDKLSLVRQTAARHNLDVGLVMSDYPLSFVWGITSSKLLLSSGTLCILTTEELLGVLEHEGAHHRRYDNFFKFLLNICVYSSLAFPLAHVIMRWRTLEIEMVCDEVAAAQTCMPLEIADAMVKMGKQKLAQLDSISSWTIVTGFIPEDKNGLEKRVRRLLNFADELPSLRHVEAISGTNKLIALLTISFFAVTLLVISFVAPLTVHHATESLINLLG